MRERSIGNINCVLRKRAQECHKKLDVKIAAYEGDEEKTIEERSTKVITIITVKIPWHIEMGKGALTVNQNGPRTLISGKL